MAENTEAERHFSQAMLAAVSVALGVAVQVQQQRASRARAALAESEARQREIAAQLAAERETAAVLWRKLENREWVQTKPDEVAQAWASARAWEQVDPRAAEASARFEALSKALYGEEHVLARHARETEDYRALAQLLHRALDVDPALEGKTRFFEQVPPAERRAWLEEQVWSREPDEQTRIARSRELADLDAGLPVSVLREMDEPTRQAWLELQAMDPQQRFAWRRAWLEEQVWGRGDDEALREARARELDAVLESTPDAVRDFTPEEWHAFASQVRARVDRVEVPRADSGPSKSEATPAEAAESSPPKEAVATKAPRESQEQRLERTRATVIAAWPDEVAQAVTNNEAFGAFAHRLHQLEERGYAMEDILGKINPGGLIGLDRRGAPIRNSAAFAEYYVRQLAESLPPRADAVAGIERLEQYVAEQTEPSPTEAETPPKKPQAEVPTPSQAPPSEPTRQPIEPDLLRRAADRVAATQNGGSAALQRHLGVSYRDVDAILGELEKRGIVSGSEGGQPRRVLVDPSMVDQKLNPQAAQPAPSTESTKSASANLSLKEQRDNAEKAIRAVWPHDADWIIASQSDSMDKLASELDKARLQGHDPSTFLRDAIKASGKERLSQPNSRPGESAEPPVSTTYEPGITHPGQLGTNPPGFAALQVRRRLADVGSAQPAQASERAERAVNGPASPWSRSGADERGLGGSKPRTSDLDAAAREQNFASEDHDRVNRTQAERNDLLNEVGTESTVETTERVGEQAEALDTAIQRDRAAAGEHEQTAESHLKGAYDNGAEPAQLAGRSYPDEIRKSLAKGPKKRGNRQGAAKPQARIHRGPEAERGR